MKFNTNGKGVLRIVAWIVALITMGAATETLGGELVVHGVSSHKGGDSSYNNYNVGVGLRLNSGLIAGAYYNSYRSPTAYLGYEWMPTKYAGGFVAVATGYDRVSNTPVSVIGGFMARLPVNNTATFDVRYLPRIKDNPEVVHIGFSKAVSFLE